MSGDIRSRKLSCGCEVHAEISHDWVDQVNNLDDAWIDYCPKHAMIDECIAALMAVEWVYDESAYKKRYCPWCRGWEAAHEDDCPRQVALSKTGAIYVTVNPFGGREYTKAEKIT